MNAATPRFSEAVRGHPADPFSGAEGTLEAWYRIVTWSERSAGSELVGWCTGLGSVSEAAWDYFRALSSWRHAQAATRMHEPPGGAPPKPSAHDLLLAYRRADREEAAPHDRVMVHSRAVRHEHAVVRDRSALVGSSGSPLA